MLTDNDYMQRCFALAERGRNTSHPNPVVGCVVVSDGEIVAEGWHQLAGHAHAEINALQQAGARARNSTVYVSLEPCVHHGRTGPCTDALIANGVKRVVYAMQDPNPLVCGKGLAVLQNAGIEVAGPIHEPQAEALNPGFIKRMRTGLPYVRCKLGMSLDGRTAMQSGESKWITGAEAREDVQQLRARSSAILTGAGTVLQDNPSLTVRLPGYVGKQPLRVIVDSQLRINSAARILQEPGMVVVATAVEHADHALKLFDTTSENSERQLIIKTFDNGAGKVDLLQLMRYLAASHHCNEILLEAGAILGGAMLRAGLIDEIVAYVAPSVLGSEAFPMFLLPGMQRLSEQFKLEFLDVAMLGKDCRIRSLVLPAA
ncbi:MAG: bifunctional diaminohydroxyphosphoribosylaminopyrimidine deaminase/5-amino-6-(5-phosphoribosylamino)uracil reductase RibD [Pseudomonadota bacterium]